MRKLLGLLVAAVFVVTAAGSAMAAPAPLMSSDTVKQRAFRAEVMFFKTGIAEFGFDLYRMAAAKPKAWDTTTDADEAAEIDWAGVSIAAGNGNAGGPEDVFKASKVYAKIVNKAYTAKTKVLFYTDNTGSKTALGTDAYKYTVDAATTPYGVGSAQTINALVEKNGSTGLNTSAGHATLPLAYRIEVADIVDADSSYDVSALKYQETGTPTEGSLFYVTDLAKTARTTPGDESDAYTEAYATISTTAGMKFWEDYTNSNQEKFYMFFASNFANAFTGNSYGTDSLTVELVVEP